DAQLLRLSGYERHRHIMAAIRTEGLQLGFTGDVRRTRHHAVAHLHGCEGAAAPGVRRLILGISSDTEPKEVALLIDPRWSATLTLPGLWKGCPSSDKNGEQGLYDVTGVTSSVQSSSGFRLHHGVFQPTTRL